MRTTRQEKTEIERKKRVPLGNHRAKLTVDGIPSGHVGRWVNDKDGRIQSALEAGYQFVGPDNVFVGQEVWDGNSDVGHLVSRVVDRDGNGNPIKAYLMAIKQEWYDADQEEKLAGVRRIEHEIKTGQVHRTENDGRYIPRSGISVSNKTGEYRP